MRQSESSWASPNRLTIDRMANAIAQEPKYVRDDIANLVAGEQLPGSFGDLIKQSVEIVEAHKEFEGSNVVSMMGRR